MGDFYRDREQTEAKHALLRRYLENFAHKVVRTYGSIDYVDAFCGPWEERDAEGLSDTSIAIALSNLQSVAETLPGDRKTAIRCIFNEKNKQSFARLEAFIDSARDKYPLLEIHTLNGVFEDNVAKIKRLATNKFMLLFVDPTGWSGFSPDALKALSGQRNSEIMINFMRSFVERFLCPPVPEQADRLRELLGAERSQRLAGKRIPITEIEEELTRVLKEDLGFRFAASSPIHNPDRNQIHFQMFYGTHHPAGMEVMRQAEFKALSQHDQSRFNKAQDPQQPDFLAGLVDVEGPYLRERRQHLKGLRSAILERLDHSSHNLKFSTLRAGIQEQLFLRGKEIGDAVIALAAEGLVEPTWKTRGGKRPIDDDLMRRRSG
ncbi:three-Cys-motif partner protein TcmP [Maritimibacter sp. HL-12]|uniref:three-Cys-motif partner protein TcmP n=1 Tax=Maritimibacter sp. HL-12 TaxID=1162418 RepID=UPI000A0F2B85|nr:three-Cys-motif partner protein TcmP [Maritimibacter sp. HL-12]SMH35638.1 three-Cys-motif partner protein [Maritimibacter sp. HL-12]